MVSAVKIRNTYNGLCLDAPDGVKGSSALKLTFVRDPNTRQETLSFMTPDKASELSVLPDDIAGSLATFAPVEAPSGNKCVRYEWIAYN
ncbi:hypothetical protein BGX29_008153 [Mortierella sp. GBA35]|nr:hypothetical protein BGX29_008153 [Mortierella sp. GBA35]